MDILTKRIDDMTKRNSKKEKKDREKSEKGLLAELFDWVDESVSSDDERITKIREFMAIVEDEPSDEIINLKKVIEKWTCSKVTLDQLLSKQVPRNIVKALGRKGKRKEKISSKEEPFPPLPKLKGVAPSSTSGSVISLSDLTLNIADLTLDTLDLKKTRPFVKGNHLFDDCYSKPKCSTCGSTNHLTKEHLEHVVVKKTLNKLKAQSPLKPSLKKAAMILKPFIECKYYGFSDHHFDFYHGREVCGSIAHKHLTVLRNTPTLGDQGLPTRNQNPFKNRYLKERGPKVIFGDDSSGDTEVYGSVNCNGITFTKVAYVNGLKHNLISISQLCDANYKVLFTKTQGTIYNQNDEVILITPRRRDVYTIDMSSFNKESNACFFAKASLTCKKGKHHRASFKTKILFSINKSLHLLHMDLFRPVTPQTISHNKYTLVIVDEYSRRQEMKETIHITFHKDDEAISQSSTEESADLLEPAEPQTNVIFEPISDDQPSPTISPLAEVILQTPVPQDRWLKEKHIELVNIIGEPLDGITTRSKIRDLDIASAFECLYVNFLSEMEPKKLIKALEEEGWIIVMQEELNQFERNKVWALVPKPHGKTIIGTKWIWKNKMDENGIVITNMARLVTQGYNQ
uniref:Retrovirus-related Pol polyprotein from transposon TNT 1-94 n=1 Tax=Tanacetum cinerariifolium TaxID=118510 RepID=A0A699H5J6_TANCI|nr:retrovirus-related Pol polyprotein from transposon TNT 1-94 [Tanacetum cinerariifolium]